MSHDEPQQPHPRHEELESLIGNNRDILKSLSREGVKINPDAIDSGRHAFFIERLIAAMPEDERYEFEIEWQKRVEQILHNTGRDARRRRLLAGGHKPKGGAPTILTPGSQNGGRNAGA